MKRKTARTLVIAIAPFAEAAMAVGPLASRRAVNRSEFLAVAASPGLCDVLASQRLVDETHEVGSAVRGAGPVVGAWRAGRLVTRSRASRFDSLIDLFPTGRSVLASWAACGTLAMPETIRYFEGLTRRRLVEGPRPDPVAVLSARLGVAGVPTDFELRSEPESDAWIERALGAIGYQGGPVVLMHTGGAWPDDRFADVGGRLRGAFDATLVIVDTPREPGPARAIAGAVGGRVLALGAPSGSRYVAAIERSSIVITDNPGGFEMARLGRVPVVEAAGSSDEVFESACASAGRQRTGALFGTEG